jgi:hypothetical protein
MTSKSPSMRERVLEQVDVPRSIDEIWVRLPGTERKQVANAVHACQRDGTVEKKSDGLYVCALPIECEDDSDDEVESIVETIYDPIITIIRCPASALGAVLDQLEAHDQADEEE